MKIIDLLNKIANGEEVPKKIKYGDNIFEYDNLEKCYITDNFDHTVVNDLSIYLDGYKKTTLNDEVEIIEDSEEKKIKKLEIECEEITDPNTNERKRMRYNYNDTMSIVDKINELVDKVNELSKE